jgi:flagellar protein FlaJ
MRMQFSERVPFRSLFDAAPLRKALRGAHIPVPLSRYLRQTALTTAGVALVYLAVITVLGMAGYEILLFSVIPDPVTKVVLFLVLVPGVFAALYAYPFLVAQGRKTRIDLDLPYAITYMEALSTTMTPFEVIRKVYEEMDLFGEVSKEFGIIVREVELFGEDLYSAMRNLQRITPSAHLADFLNDLILLSDSGGDITAFLASRAGYFRDAAEREMEMAMKTIEIMAEVYVTAFVAGPIVVIVMVLSQNLAGQGGLSGWMPLILVAIPLGALVMIALLSIIIPGENLRITRNEAGDREYPAELQPAMTGQPVSRSLEKSLKARRRRHAISRVIRHPFRHYISSYTWSLILAAVLGLSVVLCTVLGYTGELFPTAAPEAAICLFTIAVMLPPMVAYEGRRWFVHHVERQMPEFLRELADMKEIGMTLQGAIHRIANTKLGVLSSELRITSEELRRGVSVDSALVRMEERIGLVSVKRALSLVVKASEITDSLKEILVVAISDFEHYLKMKKERYNAAFTYVMVVYLSFGVFLYTAYQLNTQFLASFTHFNLALDTAGNVSEMFHIAIVLGAFSGIMAGQLSANSILAGFKHSIVFLVATVFLFTRIMGGV